MREKIRFAMLDPRPLPEAEGKNDEFFSSSHVLGIEVTVPQLADRCLLGNIDPQHSGGDVEVAAIEAAMTCPIPTVGEGEELVLATVRADLDSVGAMAVIAMRAAGSDLSEVSDRVRMIAEADKFSNAGWPGVRDLPSRRQLWPEAGAGVESVRDLAAIAALVSDFRVPIDDRVQAMRLWLQTGTEPAEYRDRVEREQLDLVNALDTGRIQVSVLAESCVAVVRSEHRAATTIGYHLAPVVIALNPEFRFQGGEPHRKYTVCQYSLGFVDLPAVLAELGQLESGWGGSPSIIGSPQGEASRLTIDQIVEVVSRHLAPAS